jgi:antirestriction protein ArdC
MKNNPQSESESKRDVYQIITDRILDLLQRGVVPWQKPWASNGQDCLPRNLVSGKAYRGINVFLLNAMSYGSPYWLSFKQAQELGGNVRKGEKSTPIVFWKWLEGTDEQTGEKKRIPFLRYYSAFNASQCDGIEFPKVEATGREHSAIETAERIVANMPKLPPVQHGGDRACYSPALDMVRMPAPETFQTGEHYYSVLLHELTHATGHQSRLNRKGVAGSEGEWSAFGSTPYAKEELLAEMGAAFLCSHAGIVERTIDNSAAYIAGWLERLKDDNRLVVQAAAQAQKASDFILGTQPNEQSEANA